MKKILSLFLILVFVLSSCTHANEDPKENEPEKNKQVTYIIYGYASEGSSGTSESENEETVKFASMSERDFNFIDRTEVKNDKAPAKIEVNTGKKAFSMTLRKSYITSIYKCYNENLSHVGEINVYRTEDGMVLAEFRQQTKELVFFLNYDGKSYNGELTDEKAKELADDLFVSLYGENVFKKYTNFVIYQSNTNTSVHYKRYVHGYETDDDILIKFNKHGELYSLNANRMGTFEYAEETISKADIEKAVKVLTDTLGEKWTTFEPHLTIDSTGTYFVVMGASNGDYVEQFYININ